MKSAKLICCLSLLLILIAGGKSGTIEELKDNSNVIRKVNTSQKVVALTFDDGPQNVSTSEILETLKEKNVKATFFVVGEMVELYPDLVSREVLEGHEVGNHTYKHHRLTQLDKANLNNEISRSDELLSKIGTKPKLLRPPEGKYNSSIVRLAKEKGYTVILWSVDPYDWKYLSVGEIVNLVLESVKPGSIILLHDGKYPSATPEAVSLLIDILKERGYKFVTVSELMQYNE